VTESSHSNEAFPEPEQEVVYDLMRQRLFELFGPGGSFRVTLGRATPGEAVFASTVADTVAWDIASALGAQKATPARHETPRDPQSEHEELWSQIESELLIRRTGPNGFMGDLQAQPAPVLEESHAPERESDETSHVSQAARLSAVRAA
jgi:hypothetical protein